MITDLQKWGNSRGLRLTKEPYSREASLTGPDRRWWDELSTNDPYCRADPEGEARIIQQDAGRWLTYGYIVAGKPD